MSKSNGKFGISCNYGDENTIVYPDSINFTRDRGTGKVTVTAELSKDKYAALIANDRPEDHAPRKSGKKLSSHYPQKSGDEYYVNTHDFEQAINLKLNVLRATLNVLDKNPDEKFMFPRDAMRKRLLEGYAKANEYYLADDLASALLVLESVWDDVGYVGAYVRKQGMPEPAETGEEIE